MRDALIWYLVIQVAAVACWPLVARALPALADRGWAVAKTAGLLSAAWLVWFVCMLTPLPYTRPTLAVAVVLIGAIGWTLTARSVGGLAAVWQWLAAERRLLVAWEVLFLATFVLFALLRSRDPAVNATEKPMDMAFLNGFMSARSLPTQDTWLAGFGEPYYHFGYFILASVAKLADVPPGVAYNLAVSTVPALAMVALASLAWTLARTAGASVEWSAAGAAVASALALVCGNLSTFFEFLYARGVVGIDAGNALGIKNFGQGIVVGQWPPTAFLWWFKASRVIPNLQPDGINEFPFFSAVWADLHPHFMALPFELLVVAIAATHALTRGVTLRSWWTQGLAALALGGLLVINTWDIAPFWLLYWGLAMYAAWLLRCDTAALQTTQVVRQTEPAVVGHGAAVATLSPPEDTVAAAPPPAPHTPVWQSPWLLALVAPFAGALLYFPYFVGYSGPPLGLGIVTGDRTPLGSLFVLFGWAIALLLALGLFMRWRVADRRGWTIVGISAALGIALTVLGQPGLGILAFALGTLLPWPRAIERLEPATAVTIGIAAFAMAMLLGVEIVFLDDVFHSRMNTVFKFHENAWLLAGLAAGVGIALIGQRALRARWIVAALAALFIAGGLVYPLSVISSRLAERPPNGPTLDGLAWMGSDDRAAVRWLSDQNATGRAVVAEAVGNEYDASAGGMATYSGAVTVLGWAGHEVQWRGPVPELGVRQSDLAALYRDAPPEAIRSLLDKYNIRFVVVSDVERRTYGDQVSTRFEGLLPIAFHSGPITIYRAR